MVTESKDGEMLFTVTLTQYNLDAHFSSFSKCKLLWSVRVNNGDRLIPNFTMQKKDLFTMMFSKHCVEQRARFH